MPRSTANIDHMAVAASGIWVIDAKRYKGAISKQDRGGWLETDFRLVVGGRDRTSLAAGGAAAGRADQPFQPACS